MKITKEELLDKLKRAYEMEEVMAGLLADLAVPRALILKIQDRDRKKVYRLLSLIHADTLEHQKIVSGIIRDLSGGSHGV